MRRIHLTLWDCRSILPLGNGPLRCSRDGRYGDSYGYPMRWDWFHVADWSHPANARPLRALADHRERWLSTRRACTGVWLAPRNLREMFDSTEDPTCPECVRLWQSVQVFRDMRQERAA